MWPLNRPFGTKLRADCPPALKRRLFSHAPPEQNSSSLALLIKKVEFGPNLDAFALFRSDKAFPETNIAVCSWREIMRYLIKARVKPGRESDTRTALKDRRNLVCGSTSKTSAHCPRD